MTTIEELRKNIDDIDQKIIVLLAQRFKYTEEVGIYKATNQLDAQDAESEFQQFQKIVRLSEQSGLNPEYASEIYRNILDIVISRHQEIIKVDN